MAAKRNKEKLLKRRSEILIELALYDLMIEEQTFYSIPALEQEVEALEAQLKYEEEQSLKDPKKEDK
jgi:hypothetical protein